MSEEHDLEAVDGRHAMVLKTIVATVGMIAVGVLVWKALQRQEKEDDSS
jgi:hypothetical protein